MLKFWKKKFKNQYLLNNLIKIITNLILLIEALIKAIFFKTDGKIKVLINLIINFIKKSW